VTKAKAIEILNRDYDGAILRRDILHNIPIPARDILDDVDHLNDLLTALLTAIDVLKQSIESEPVNDWINVKDRLPENLNDVIACDVRGNVFSAYYFSLTYEWQYAFTTAEPCEYEITHWRPLPEPPESEDEK
jgi:hypothetical protein